MVAHARRTRPQRWSVSVVSTTFSYHQPATAPTSGWSPTQRHGLHPSSVWFWPRKVRLRGVPHQAWTGSSGGLCRRLSRSRERQLVVGGGGHGEASGSGVRSGVRRSERRRRRHGARVALLARVIRRGPDTCVTRLRGNGTVLSMSTSHSSSRPHESASPTPSRSSTRSAGAQHCSAFHLRALALVD